MRVPHSSPLPPRLCVAHRGTRASDAAVRFPALRALLPRHIQLLLVILVALASFQRAEGAGATAVWVSPTGSDGGGVCGASSLSACATIQTALQQLLPLTAGVTPVVWLNDGTYTGAGNRNIELGAYLPLRLAAVNSGAAVIDAQLLGPILHIATNVTMADPVTTTSIEGITFKRASGLGYGAVLIEALGAHMGSAITFSRCSFQDNQVSPRAMPFAYAIVSAAAAVILNAALPTSAASANHPSLVPYSIPSQDPFSNATQAPASAVSSSWINHATAAPMASTDLAAAVAFIDCDFRGNLALNPFFLPYLQYTMSSSVAVDKSYVSFRGCAFTEHVVSAAQPQAIAQFNGIGATVIDNCMFSDNSQSVLLQDSFDMSVFTALSTGHNLLVVHSIFERNGNPAALAAPTSFLFFQANVLLSYGFGNNTLINCTVRGGWGTSFILGGSAVTRVINTVFEDMTLGSQTLMWMATAQPIVWVDSTVRRCSGLVSLLMSSIVAPVMHFERCLFADNTVTAMGGLLDMRQAAAAVVVRLQQCTVRGNNAVAGTIVSMISTSAKFVMDACTVTDNNAANTGGTLLLASGEAWVNHCTFLRNSAPTGGVLTAQSGSTVHIGGGTEMSHNLATDGGALYFEPGATATIRAVLFHANHAVLTGGAVYDASFVSYASVVFDSNVAVKGAGLFIPSRPQALVSLPSALVLADSPLCSVALRDVTFVHNVASTVGSGIMFDSAELPCDDFCGPVLSDWTGTDRVDWISENARCNFTANQALSGYGNNFGIGLFKVEWSASMAAGSPSLAPGVAVDLSLQLFDEMNRTMGVTGGGVEAFNFHMLVFDDSTGELLSPLPLPTPVGVQQLLDSMGAAVSLTPSSAAAVPMSSDALSALPVNGVVTFHRVQLIAPVGAAIRLAVVSADRTVLPMVSHMTVAPCPAGFELLPSLLSAPSGAGLLSCQLRPAFLSGDSLDLTFDVALALLSVFVCVIGTWTTLILLEQVVSARARKQRFVHWVALCTAALGVSGIWSSAVIAVSSARITNHVTGASLGFDLDPTFLFFALLALVALPFIGLCVAVSDPDFSAAQKAQMKGLRKLIKYQKYNMQPAWRDNQRGGEEDSMPSDDESALRDQSIQRNSLLKSVHHSKDTPAGAADGDNELDEYLHNDAAQADGGATAGEVPDMPRAATTSMPHESPTLPSHKLHHAVSVASEVPSAAVTAAAPPTATADAPLKATAAEPSEEAAESLRSFVLRKALSPRIVVGLLLAFSGMACGVFLCLASLHPHSDIVAHWDGGIMAAAIVAALPLFYAAVLGYFYLFTKLRTALVFVLTASYLICQYVAGASLHLTYRSSAQSVSGLDPSTITLVAFSISMISCIVFIGINVVSLRLSRHQLGQAMQKMTLEIARQHNTLLRTRETVHELRTWLNLSNRARAFSLAKNTKVRAAAPPAQVHPHGMPMLASPSHSSVSGAGGTDPGASTPSVTEPGAWSDASSLLSLISLSRNPDEVAPSGPEDLLLSSHNKVADSKVELSNQLLKLLQTANLLTATDLSALAASLPRPTLESVILHPACVSFFIEHAAHTYNEDMLLCFLSIHQYRRMKDGPTRMLIATQIVVDCLDAGGEHEVNVSGRAKASLRSKVHGSVSVLPHDLFDPLGLELVALMKANLWPSFENTRSYYMCALILQATKKYAKTAQTKADDREELIANMV